MTVATVDERYWARVQGGDYTGCWTWTAEVTVNGYGVMRLVGAPRQLAHRYSYTTLRAEVPAGLDLDHLCRNRACVNPWHLEPVTRRVNVLRGMRGRLVKACPKGHPYNEENTSYRRSNGRRLCKTCARAWAAEVRRRKKADDMDRLEHLADGEGA